MTLPLPRVRARALALPRVRARALALPRVRARALAALAVPLVLLALLLPASPAAAHAALVSSTPADGARVDALPGQVELTFTDEIAAPAYVVVTAPDGTSVTRGKPAIDGTSVRQQLTDGGSGAYTIGYRVVSADGHAVNGELGFRVSGAADRHGGRSAAGHDGAADHDGPSDQGTARAGLAASDEPGFWERHATHVIIGAVLFALAIGLLLLSRRSPE